MTAAMMMGMITVIKMAHAVKKHVGKHAAKRKQKRRRRRKRVQKKTMIKKKMMIKRTGRKTSPVKQLQE